MVIEKKTRTRTKNIKNCPSCSEELGIVSVRFSSRNYTMAKIENMFYCVKCKKFLKLKTEFIEL